MKSLIGNLSLNYVVALNADSGEKFLITDANPQMSTVTTINLATDEIKFFPPEKEVEISLSPIQVKALVKMVVQDALDVYTLL